MYTNDRNFTIWYWTFCYLMFLLNKVNQVRVTIWKGGQMWQCQQWLHTFQKQKHGLYLSMVSLDGVYMGATVWRQDKLLVLLFYSGVRNEHVKQTHSKTLVQTVINLHNSSPRFSRFTANNVEGREDLWHHLMHLKWNCCYNVVSICKLFPVAMAAQRIRQQTYRMKSGEQPGYCTTSHLHCQWTFLRVSTEWVQPVQDTSHQTQNISGTAEMTCNTVPSQCDPVEWGDTKQHVKWSTAFSVINFSKTCIFIIHVDSNIQSLAF